VRLRLALVALLLVTLPACRDDNDEGPPPLADFTFADAHFKARFPSPPKRSERDVPTAAGTLHLVTYTAEVRTTYGFSVGWFQLAEPPAADAVRPFLDSTQRGSVTAVKGELESSEYITVGDSPGIEYVAKMEAGGFVKARTVLAGKDVYVLQMIAEDRNAPQYTEFIEGFHVL
jgi:hypothetical protein